MRLTFRLFGRWFLIEWQGRGAAAWLPKREPNPFPITSPDHKLRDVRDVTWAGFLWRSGPLYRGPRP